MTPESEDAQKFDMAAEENRDKGMDDFSDNIAKSQEMFLKAVETVPFLKERITSMVKLAAEEGVL